MATYDASVGFYVWARSTDEVEAASPEEVRRAERRSEARPRTAGGDFGYVGGVSSPLPTGQTSPIIRLQARSCVQHGEGNPTHSATVKTLQTASRPFTD